MNTRQRRWAVAAAALVALLAAAWLAVRAWIPSDEELARKLEAAFEARLGQPLVVGQLRWRLLGLPAVEVRDVRTEQAEPIQVRRLTVYPQLRPLMRRQLVIDRLEVDGAVLPRKALLAFQDRTPSSTADIVLHTLAFTDLTYTSYSGIPVAYDGEIQFAEDGLPSRVRLSRPGVAPPATLDAVRDGETDNGAHRYRLELQAAGGSARGQARLATSAQGRLVLTGELAPRNVEVQALLAAFHRRSAIAGLASGETTLRAEGESLDGLFRTLRTRSTLEVQRAQVLRIDVQKAIQTMGKERAGQTDLQHLSGVMETQNTEHGMKIQFTQVKAASEGYSATGWATLYRGQLAAEGKLDIAGGLVGVPFSAHGPTREPDFRIARGTLAGAAIGTLLLPGIGTAIGAQIGGAVTGPPKPETDEPPPARRVRPPR